MSLEQKVMTDLKTAILVAKTSEGADGDLKEEDEVKLLQKLLKSRKDSLEIFTAQHRSDLALKEQEEIAIIEKFLPAQMDAGELRTVIQKIIADTGASSPADMGKVMGVATKQLAGKIDGKSISTMVKELLAK